ncbi:hypothetical protein [Nocardia sp. alder85J]|nr:hypothetical protein [Nocardia sp. alder85J]MCX4091775.1 hypothetical protein [Nocardia sp. alder85J]
MLSDACADPDPELHHLLTTRTSARRGDVLTGAEWAAGLGV